MYDVVIIGAGQAGLSMGYYLSKTNCSYVLLDKAKEIGESWRTRYDSLTLFTPREYSQLPGLNMNGSKQGYPTKDQVADYLEQYAEYQALPVQLETEIKRVTQTDTGFRIETSKDEVLSRNVVVATGPFQTPFIPSFEQALSSSVFQLHSSQYKNPSQLKNGPVLVVGGGNSGAQIAAELSGEREVFLSVGQKLTLLPQDIGGKSIFWWFDKLGILNASVTSKLGSFLKSRPDPIFGFELKRAIKRGKITIKSRVIDIKNDTFIFQDKSELAVPNVVWSTGFQSAYQWLHIPNLFDQSRQPIHKRGITNINGLYFLGLPWQFVRGSALLQGVAADADYIYRDLQDKGFRANN
ncbi:flavin-containing monooxygenase [Ferdinandcohnia sp. Marseille-Q9671]